MSSDKNKPAAAGTRRKTRATANAASLKQKTLFDSFFVKNAPPKDPVAAETAAPTVDAQTSSAAVRGVIALTPSVPEVEDPVPQVSETISIDDSPEPQPFVELAVPATEPILIDDDDSTEGPVHPEGHDLLLERQRSPSIAIIDHIPSVSLISTGTIRGSHAVSQLTPKQEGKTAAIPIVIESSPIKDTSSFKLNKPIHPFFGGKLKASTSSSASTPLPRKTPAIQQAPRLPSYPDRNAQHVRGLQTSISGYQPVFPTRTISDPSKQATEPPDYNFLTKENISEEYNQSPTYILSNTINNSVLSNIPQEHRDKHPAIIRVLDYNPDEPFESRRPWSEKWRPTCAQEVLGNEQSAVYLRNWLRALELQFEDPANPPAAEEAQGKTKSTKRNLKRARIVRAVDKKRKKSRIDSDEEDDWIVQTDDEEEENVTYESIDDLDDLFFAQPASSSPSRCPDPSASLPQASKETKEPDLGQLHNTILLVGPHGAGKTASVYACAEELGWDVFEVYPGIGRRNGANVDNLVGEVGKNHLVLQNRQNVDPLKSLFRQQNKQTSQSSIEDTRSGYSPRKASTVNASATPETDEPLNVRAVRQSLILLEEVDILYKEDSNFWSAVIRIIKECKRPVICTCNDISLVPLEELPLQSVLYFEPTPADIAVSYLSGLCAAEGRLVERELVAGLYRDPAQSSEAIPKWDLRRNINTLQVLSATANSIEHAKSRECDENGHGDGAPAGNLLSIRRSETLSFLDGMLHLNSMYHTTMTEMASYLPSEDDEMGHAILYDRHGQDTSQSGQYDRHEEMLSSGTRLLRKMFDVDAKDDGTGPFEEKGRNVGDAHRRVLVEVCPTGVWARRDGVGALDYIPLIRQMVAADDAEEVREGEKRRGVGRSTRNSARSGYVRMIGMTEEGRRVLWGCGLGR